MCSQPRRARVETFAGKRVSRKPRQSIDCISIPYQSSLSMDLQPGRRGIPDHALHNHDLRERDWNRRPDATLSRHVRKLISPKKCRAQRWRGASGRNSCWSSVRAPKHDPDRCKAVCRRDWTEHNGQARWQFDDDSSRFRIYVVSELAVISATRSPDDVEIRMLARIRGRDELDFVGSKIAGAIGDIAVRFGLRRREGHARASCCRSPARVRKRSGRATYAAATHSVSACRARS